MTLPKRLSPLDIAASMIPCSGECQLYTIFLDFRLLLRSSTRLRYSSVDIWLKTFEINSLSPEFYSSRERTLSEILPWSVISSGVCNDYLWGEREAAYKAVKTSNCREQCSGCGISKSVAGAVCYG